MESIIGCSERLRQSESRCPVSISINQSFPLGSTCPPFSAERHIFLSIFHRSPSELFPSMQPADLGRGLFDGRLLTAGQRQLASVIRWRAPCRRAKRFSQRAEKSRVQQRKFHAIRFRTESLGKFLRAMLPGEYACLRFPALLAQPVISRQPSIRNPESSPKELNMKIESLRDLFETELRYTYDCEEKLVKKGLPSMIEAANSAELRSALEQHLQETKTHVSRLERVFSIVGAEAKNEGNDILDKMTSFTKDLIDDIKLPVFAMPLSL